MSSEHEEVQAVLSELAKKINLSNAELTGQGIYLLTHLLTHSLTHSLTYSLTHSLTYSLTHLLTYSLTHSLTYLLA
jgi:hypothetical protein